MEALTAMRFDVKDFGATGNGITDDSAAFRAALRWISTYPEGVLEIKPGVYRISQGPLGYLHVNRLLLIGAADVARPGELLRCMAAAPDSQFSGATVSMEIGTSNFVFQGGILVSAS